MAHVNRSKVLLPLYQKKQDIQRYELNDYNIGFWQHVSFLIQLLPFFFIIRLFILQWTYRNMHHTLYYAYSVSQIWTIFQENWGNLNKVQKNLPLYFPYSRSYSPDFFRTFDSNYTYRIIFKTDGRGWNGNLARTVRLLHSNEIRHQPATS